MVRGCHFFPLPWRWSLAIPSPLLCNHCTCFQAWWQNPHRFDLLWLSCKSKANAMLSTIWKSWRTSAMLLLLPSFPLYRPWTQDSKGRRGSPCCTPSADCREWLPQKGMMTFVDGANKWIKPRHNLLHSFQQLVTSWRVEHVLKVYLRRDNFRVHTVEEQVCCMGSSILSMWGTLTKLQLCRVSAQWLEDLVACTHCS